MRPRSTSHRLSPNHLRLVTFIPGEDGCWFAAWNRGLSSPDVTVHPIRDPMLALLTTAFFEVGRIVIDPPEGDDMNSRGWQPTGAANPRDRVPKRSRPWRG